jgi:dolichol-phosphate mannosyltransferase
MNQNNKKKLSIIIPCHNEEATLPVTLVKLYEFSARLEEMDVEWVFIDDGSRDATLDILIQYADSPGSINCQIVSLSRNFGHQAAIAAGLDYCRGDIAVVIDADLQTPLETIHPMLDLSGKGIDVVHAVRVARGPGEVAKGALASGFYLIASYLLGTEMVYNSPDFKLLNRKVIDAVRMYGEDRRFSRGLIATVGFRQATVEYVACAREQGESKYSLSRMLHLAFAAFSAMHSGVLRLSIVATIFLDMTLLLFFFLGCLGVAGMVVGLLISIQFLLVLILIPYTLQGNRLLRQRPLYIVDQERSRVV